jgi:preprotein translocase subunit SecG
MENTRKNRSKDHILKKTTAMAAASFMILSLVLGGCGSAAATQSSTAETQVSADEAQASSDEAQASSDEA